MLSHIHISRFSCSAVNSLNFSDTFLSISDNIDMNIKMLGLNIRAERNRQELSQEQLAELVDMSPTSINSIERGKQIPNALNLYLISKVLKVDIGELFKGIE